MRATLLNAAILSAMVGSSGLGVTAEEGGIRSGDPEWPVAWVTYREVSPFREDIESLKSHGVRLLSEDAGSVEEAKRLIKIAREEEIKYHIDLPEVTENDGFVRQTGSEPVDAIMIGGVYRGKAIDRHLFSFTPEKHRIVIEPPVYNKGFAYTRGSDATGRQKEAEPIAHYFPDMPKPVRAEVVVPLKRYDGRQHIKIVDASIKPAPKGTEPEIDSVTPDMPESQETGSRQLYELSFDLTGLDEALLDKVGVAVYWPYHGTDKYWIFGNGTVSAAAPSTREALRSEVSQRLEPWTKANGGSFPSDVVPAARLGDECFYITSHLNSPAVTYPLWDYSKPSIAAFKRQADSIAFPRTWGFPEVYGRKAYAWWQYLLHKHCAELAGAAQDALNKGASNLLLFRNTTRMGVFHPSNDRDGSGPELLTEHLDIVHLDPYPVDAEGYGDNIPRDMSYYAGLARRYDRPLVPWMQAHTYGGPDGLQHPSPKQIGRMARQQWQQGVDGVMWLGYGGGWTFPNVRPKSWERAAKFHRKLQRSLPEKPEAELAVLRFYESWALSSRSDNQIRNPADWLLQQFLEVWSVEMGKPYDVFEVRPGMTDAERDELKKEVAGYAHVISSRPFPGAWTLGKGTAGDVADPDNASAVRKRFKKALMKRGWVSSGHPGQGRNAY